MSNLRPGEKHGSWSQCGTCDHIFCGSEAFEAHRTGTYGVDRRCLTQAEMQERGFERCGLQRWKRPTTERTRPRTPEAP